MQRRPQRLSGSQLEDAIAKIEDDNARDAIYELLLRARDANEEIKSRVGVLEKDARKRT